MATSSTTASSPGDEGGKTTSFRMVGLKNAAGEQNCFLNVVIQALWRQRSCREFFSSVEDPWKKSNPVLIALTALMTEYKFSDEDILPPDQVRVALSDMFAHLNRFQLGQMDDAGESFEAILASMHSGTAATEDRQVDIDQPCKDREVCLGHQVFALDYLKEDDCVRCEHVEQNGSGTMFSFNLYAQETVDLLALLLKEDDDMADSSLLPKAIRQLDSQKRKQCPKCKSPASVCTRTVLLSLPKVLCLNLVWPAAEADRVLLNDVLNLISSSASSFRLDQAFHILDEGRSYPPYKLTGMICFYPGGHYVFFGLISSSSTSTATPTWVIFDDHQIKNVGSFEQVIERCNRAKYQPVCLFYEKQPEQQQQSRRSLPHRVAPLPPIPPPVSRLPASTRASIGLQQQQEETIPVSRNPVEEIFSSVSSAFVGIIPGFHESSSVARTSRRG
jgi:uncharacterized UBP type Zn finger protein